MAGIESSTTTSAVVGGRLDGGGGGWRAKVEGEGGGEDTYTTLRTSVYGTHNKKSPSVHWLRGVRKSQVEVKSQSLRPS